MRSGKRRSVTKEGAHHVFRNPSGFGKSGHGVNEERRCLIIDGHPTIRLGVRRLLADRYEVEEAEDGRAALDLIETIGEFDVAVVELKPPAPVSRNRLTGIKAIRALRKARPGLGIVAHAAKPEHVVAADALDAGATTFVAKSSPCEALADAIDAAAESEPYVDPAAKRANGSGGLTRRQREILQLYADGLSTERVAQRLDRSTETVRTHTKAALSRLGARDRAHAVAIGLRNSLIE
jgi:DNA-binding NarL/FixJ family response regulator